MKAISDVIMNKIIQRLKARSTLPDASYTVQTREDLDSILSTILDNMQAGSVYKVYVQDPNAVLGLTTDYTITMYKKAHNPLPDYYDRTDMATMLVDGWYHFYVLAGANLGASGWQFDGPHQIWDSGNMAADRGLVLVEDSKQLSQNYYYTEGKNFKQIVVTLYDISDDYAQHTVTIDCDNLGCNLDLDHLPFPDEIWLPFGNYQLQINILEEAYHLEVYEKSGSGEAVRIRRVKCYN